MHDMHRFHMVGASQEESGEKQGVRRPASAHIPHVVAACAAAGVLAGALALAGCSSAGTVTHQIISSENVCINCHSGDRQAYADATPANVQTCNGTVEVSTDASAVYVCRPLCGTEDGSFCIPLQGTQVSVKDGTATIQLEEGTWIVCIDTGGASSGVLVTTDASANEPLEVTLK